MRNFLSHLKTLVVALTLVTPSLALADSTLKTTFSPAAWTPGLHLLAGSGLTGSFYKAENGPTHFGPALNFKTDVGFYLNKSFALELGAHVNFIRVASEFLWDTNFTFGGRLRLPWIHETERSCPYARFFVGYGPTVVLLRGRPRPYIRDDIERVQLQGPLMGASLGLFRKFNADEPVWFLELTGTVHDFRELIIVRDHGTVPTVVDDKVITGDSALVNISVTVGFLLF